MSVTITGNADPREAQAYVEYLENKFNRKVSKLDINIDGEFADLHMSWNMFHLKESEESPDIW